MLPLRAEEPNPSAPCAAARPKSVEERSYWRRQERLNARLKRANILCTFDPPVELQLPKPAPEALNFDPLDELPPSNASARRLRTMFLRLS